MDARRFWGTPGVVTGLASLGLRVHTVDRLLHPRSWPEDAAAVAGAMSKASPAPAILVAGSNGCTTAVRIALDHNGLVSRLVLCWPATAGDPVVDAAARARIAAVADAATADRLLAGGILRGVADPELATIAVPVTVIPSDPENPAHRQSTVRSLLEAIPGARAVAGFPESLRPGFAVVREAFVAALAAALDG